MLKSRTASTIKQMDLKQVQTTDASIGKVIQHLKSGNCLQVKDLHGEHPDTRQLLHEWRKLQIDHTGILHRKNCLYTQIVLPKKYRCLVLKELLEYYMDWFPSLICKNYIFKQFVKTVESTSLKVCTMLKLVTLHLE